MTDRRLSHVEHGAALAALDFAPADHEHLPALDRYPIGIGGVDCRLLHYHVLPAKQPSGGITVQEDVADPQDFFSAAAAQQALQEADLAKAELAGALSAGS